MTALLLPLLRFVLPQFTSGSLCTQLRETGQKAFKENLGRHYGSHLSWSRYRSLKFCFDLLSRRFLLNGAEKCERPKNSEPMLAAKGNFFPQYFVSAYAYMYKLYNRIKKYHDKVHHKNMYGRYYCSYSILFQLLKKKLQNCQKQDSCYKPPWMRVFLVIWCL